MGRGGRGTVWMDKSMQDKHVSLNSLVAGVLWAMAPVLVLVDLFSDVESGELGVLLGLGATTLSVRGYFVALADRERNAFMIGRDSMRRRDR